MTTGRGMVWDTFGLGSSNKNLYKEGERRLSSSIMINNIHCSMTYSISHAVKLWLCIGCGSDTTLPVRKRHHSPQIDRNHSTPQRLRPLQPAKRRPTQEGKERGLATIQRENTPAKYSQVGGLRATHKTWTVPTQQSQKEAPEAGDIDEGNSRRYEKAREIQQWNQQTLLHNSWLQQLQPNQPTALGPAYSRPPTLSHSVVGR